MKIRSNYVSNSSSSSFILVYDPLFFGDLKTFFEKESFGCETQVYNDQDKFIVDDAPEYKEKIKKAQEEGKQVLYLGLDNEFYSIITLLKMINESNGGNKFEILYRR